MSDLTCRNFIGARVCPLCGQQHQPLRPMTDTVTVLIAQSADRPSFLRCNGRWTACKTITVDMTTETSDVPTGDQWRRFEPGPRHFKVTAVDAAGREHRIETDRDEDRRTGGATGTVTMHDTCASPIRPVPVDRNRHNMRRKRPQPVDDSPPLWNPPIYPYIRQFVETTRELDGSADLGVGDPMSATLTVNRSFNLTGRPINAAEWSISVTQRVLKNTIETLLDLLPLGVRRQVTFALPGAEYQGNAVVTHARFDRDGGTRSPIVDVEIRVMGVGPLEGFA